MKLLTTHIALVDSCKALGVDPCEWMEDVLLRLPGMRITVRSSASSCLTSGLNKPTRANLDKLATT